MPDFQLAPLRILTLQEDYRPITFGTLYGGLDIARVAWPQATQVFSVDRALAQGMPLDRPTTQEFSCVDRLPRNFLTRYRVEVVLIQPPPPGKTASAIRGGGSWERLIKQCRPTARPRYLLVVEPARRLADDLGYGSKAAAKRFRSMGYDACQWFVQEHLLGSSVVSDCAVTIYYLHGSVEPPAAPILDTLPPRPMRNNLLVRGVPYAAGRGLPASVALPPAPGPSPFQLAGRLENGRPVFSDSGPMPNRVGSLIVCDKRIKGGVIRHIRRLQGCELAKAKGIPSSWGELDILPNKLIERCPGIHSIAALGEALFPLLRGSQSPDVSEDGIPYRELPIDEVPQEPWSWHPPDLSLGSEWTRERLASLREAISGRSNEEELWVSGLQALERHRANYGPEGPKTLQLLWWEWPDRHWEHLRRGCPMNFVSYPPPQDVLMPNGDFDEETLPIAVDFVEELLKLNVLERADRLSSTAPIFVIPKVGQPGQWRVISDLREGGQNAYMAPYPVHLPRAKDILPLMYSGGYSSVVDLSKYFYNFPTAKGDREHLGVLHPGTGEYLWYMGQPMGAGSSPGNAGRFGAAFVRAVAEAHPDTFSGRPILNHPTNLMEKGSFDPKLGTGRILIGQDNLPAAWTKIHVDDLLIHGPTKAKCTAATVGVLDTAVRVGLIVQAVKTEPPSQSVKYCGFVYDSQDIPRLHIPLRKRARAISSIKYVLGSTIGRDLSRLAGAVMTGLLQSLVDATPSNIGATYLRNLYNDLHGPSNVPLVPSHPWFYLQDMTLSEESIRDLEWWESALRDNITCPARPRDCATLGVTWGDGSGTGTGVTEQLLDGSGPCPPMEMCMGTWSVSVHSFSSNWKELRTLKLALERDRQRHHFRGRLLFYFTDNIVTYWVVMNGCSSSPALMTLVRGIKWLELSLECFLIVVHVPGTLMIQQCTDGLSRGLWGSRERMRALPHRESASVFAPIAHSPVLARWMIQTICAFDPKAGSMDWTPIDFTDEWGGNLIGANTLWCLSPLVANQAIDAVLNAYVEAPLVTAAIFLVPRVMQRDWQRVSKYCVEIGIFAPFDVPTSTTHDIPFILSYLSHHVLTLPPPRTRLDRLTIPTHLRRHIRDANRLRGLQGADVNL